MVESPDRHTSAFRMCRVIELGRVRISLDLWTWKSFDAATFRINMHMSFHCVQFWMSTAFERFRFSLKQSQSDVMFAEHQLWDH